VLECLVLIASRQKGRVDKAVTELTELVTTDLGRESIMLVYALATGYIYMKQVRLCLRLTLPLNIRSNHNLLAIFRPQEHEIN